MSAFWKGTLSKRIPLKKLKNCAQRSITSGNNINQIAHSVNAGIAKAEDAKRGLCLVAQVYKLMYQITRK